MKKTNITIKGMHCKSCEVLVKDALEEQKGVRNAQVSLEKGAAIIEYDETKINEQKLKEIIRKEGYTTQ